MAPHMFQIRQRKKLYCVFLGFVIFVLLLHNIISWRSTNEHIFSQLDIDIPINFVPVMTTKRESLPSTGQVLIPKRIHQTWKSTQVPSSFALWAKTWHQQHPEWEYWFWTDESARHLISSKYPQILDTYDGYELPVQRADAMRYIILYEYGGIYADMDMEALTPLDPLARQYSCFIGQEPYEHPILDSNFQGLLINALIGCTKGHPFLKSLIDELPAYSTMWHVLDSTGPHFVTKVFKQFKDSPQFDINEVYVAPAEYFYPQMDPSKVGYFFEKCRSPKKLSTLQKNACKNLKYKNLPGNSVHDPLTFAFTNHHWSHTYLIYISSEVSIYKFVPRITIYHRPV